MIKNFFPQDTRLTELISALALICLGICVNDSLVTVNAFNFVEVQTDAFWSLVLLVLGFLQITGIALYPKAEVLRVAMSWISGSFWIWVSLAANGYTEATDVTTFLFGISNLYAFCVNSIMIHKKWVI